MSGDEPQTMRVSDLFDPEPQTWGLRGDPHLWRALRARLAGQAASASAGELANLLHAAFRELAGTDLTSDPASTAYLEQYAHGSMSSGMISLDTWRQQLMPMLFERARARLPDRPQNADQGPHDPDASLGTLRYASAHVYALEPPFGVLLPACGSGPVARLGCSRAQAPEPLNCGVSLGWRRRT